MRSEDIWYRWNQTVSVAIGLADAVDASTEENHSTSTVTNAMTS